MGEGTWITSLQVSAGQIQNIGIAVRVDTNKFNDPPFQFWDTEKNHLFDPFHMDTDGDNIEEQHHFERRSLYVEISPAQGKPFWVLGLEEQGHFWGVRMEQMVADGGFQSQEDPGPGSVHP